MRTTTYALFGILAILAGAALPVQAGLNVAVRGVLASPLRASVASFTVGIVVLVALALTVREPMPALATIARTPWWIWLGGILGAFYIVSSIVVVPRLGSAYTFALVVAGQMAAAIAIDRFGLFGVERTPFSLTRLVGAALLVGGVFLVRK